MENITTRWIPFLSLIVLCSADNKVPIGISLVQLHSEQRLHTKALSVGFKSNPIGAPQFLEGICDTEEFASRKTCNVMIDVPEGCAGQTTACPLVFAFHSAMLHNTEWIKPLGWLLHRPGYNNMIGVYPQGDIKKSGRGPGWNDDGEGDVDDIAYTLAIIDVLRKKGASGRRYAIGHSNGAALVQKLAINSALGFSGACPWSTQMAKEPQMSGSGPWRWQTLTESSCTSPIAHLSLHGTEDNLVPYEGGAFRGRILFSNTESNEVWAHHNNCSGSSEVEGNHTWGVNNPVPLEGAINVHKWKCPPTTPVEHYELVGVKHGYSRTIDGAESWRVVLNFLWKVEVALNEAHAPTEPDLPAGCKKRS